MVDTFDKSKSKPPIKKRSSSDLEVLMSKTKEEEIKQPPIKKRSSKNLDFLMSKTEEEAIKSDRRKPAITIQKTDRSSLVDDGSASNDTF